MGEDFPLDPSQVQPPQEGEAKHIEVTSHESSSQESETHRNEQPSDGEPTHLGTVNHDQVGPDYIHNKDKAEVMAHAQNDTLEDNDGKTQDEWRAGWYTEGNKPSWKSPEYAAEEAANEYDLETALSKEGWSDLRTPEEAKKLVSANRRVFLKYSHAIAENYKKYGDKLTPSLKALDMVHELVGDVGYDEFAADHSVSNENSVRVEFDQSNGGAVVVSTMRYSGQPKEQWRLPMFGKGEYTITESAGDPDGKFNRVETRKTRSLGVEDVANLGKLLEPAVKYKAQQKKWEERAFNEENDDDDYVSTTEIQNRAIARMGNTEQAREAARDFPGDFM